MLRHRSPLHAKRKTLHNHSRNVFLVIYQIETHWTLVGRVTVLSFREVVTQYHALPGLLLATIQEAKNSLRCLGGCFVLTAVISLIFMAGSLAWRVEVHTFNSG